MKRISAIVSSSGVAPAKAGVQSERRAVALDPRFRGGDRLILDVRRGPVSFRTQRRREVAEPQRRRFGRARRPQLLMDRILPLRVCISAVHLPAPYEA